MARYNTPAWRSLVACQEIGHDWGLDHQDENFDNVNLGTCMDYTRAALVMIDCSRSETPGGGVASASTSILEGSRPAPGSTVKAPVSTLELHFDPPARLAEVVIDGPAGSMPVMVHAAGEVSDYSLPLFGLGPGSYTVGWKAFRGAQTYRGSFAFQAK